MAEKLSLPKDRIKVLLTENINDSAVDVFTRQGYSAVERLKGALDGAELAEKVADVHLLGIRSRTELSPQALAAAKKLIAVGCFSIGTNQVDLGAARLAGIPVFNAPYSNTRSVAELVLAEIIMLFRGIPEKNWSAHEGGWLKSAIGSYEVRGKTLGVVGYGHIGSQVSVLAESLGLRVLYYDVIDKLALGNARGISSLDDLLRESDAVTLHVPATAQTAGLIGADEIAKMKRGAILLNASRGNVVDIEALAAALATGHLAGAAIDVFPAEPRAKDDEFVSPLRGLRNVILTPHIGGSTEEAQANIGVEVADKLVRFSDNGSTLGAVNFPEADLPVKRQGLTRFVHIHRNIPGVISAIAEVFSTRSINLVAQYLQTDPEIGYVVVDVDAPIEQGMGIRRALEAIDGTVRVRFLF
ncbi:MAG: phosphoglycerate dehydrogenase [Pseudomonadota bacterium]